MKPTTFVTSGGVALNELSGNSAKPPVPPHHVLPTPSSLNVRLHSNWARGEVQKNEVRQYIQVRWMPLLFH